MMSDECSKNKWQADKKVKFVCQLAFKYGEAEIQV